MLGPGESWPRLPKAPDTKQHKWHYRLLLLSTMQRRQQHLSSNHAITFAITFTTFFAKQSGIPDNIFVLVQGSDHLLLTPTVLQPKER